ncbi:hypothetical protein ACSFA7_00565 [Variovorax sp. LT1R20]|uniref:hypothetical protein n=1 Tax=Variovorax sp. LT1R20 TaxID=3443729 RepID=UPI003F48EBFC
MPTGDVNGFGAWKSAEDIDADLHAFSKSDQLELSLYRLRSALKEDHPFSKEILPRYQDALILSGNVNAALELRASEPWKEAFQKDQKGMDVAFTQLIAGQIAQLARRLEQVIDAFPFEFATYLAGLKRHHAATYKSIAGIARPLIEQKSLENPQDAIALKLAIEGFEGYGEDIQKEILIDFFESQNHETLCKFFQTALPANGKIFREFVADILQDEKGIRRLKDAAICRVLILGYALLDEAVYDRALQQVRESVAAEKGGAALSSARIARAFRVAVQSPPRELNRQQLDIAVCISGQMRGYAEAFETWKHLHLDGHRVKYFVHTWEDTGWRFPDPLSGNGVDRIFKHAPFAHAYRQAGFQYGLEALKKSYPNFFSKLAVSSTINESDIKAIYGNDTAVVIESHQRPEFENDANNQRKMFYKIQEAHRLMMDDGGIYDLVLRIRPDRAFRASGKKADWIKMAEECRKQRIIYFNNLMVTKTLYAGDQFAIGSPEAIGCYANTLRLQTQAIDEKWFGFPRRLRSHCSLAHSLLFQGVRRRPLENIVPVEAMPAAAYGKNELRKLLAVDLPSGPSSEMDKLLWNSLS